MGNVLQSAGVVPGFPKCEGLIYFISSKREKRP